MTDRMVCAAIGDFYDDFKKFRCSADQYENYIAKIRGMSQLGFRLGLLDYDRVIEYMARVYLIVGEEEPTTNNAKKLIETWGERQPESWV